MESVAKLSRRCQDDSDDLNAALLIATIGDRERIARMTRTLARDRASLRERCQDDPSAKLEKWDIIFSQPVGVAVGDEYIDWTPPPLDIHPLSFGERVWRAVRRMMRGGK